MKMTEKTIWYVEYSDFDKAVNETYGLTDYEFAADEESGNDEAHEFYVDGELDEWEVREIGERMFAGGNHSFMASTILNDMANKNLIPKGNYIISVSW